MGFGGRTGLVRDRGAVGAQVVLLFANAAADAQDVAVIVQIAAEASVRLSRTRRV